MDTDIALRIVARWAHILAAIVAVGGTVFLRFVLLPAASSTLDPERRAALRERLMARWRVVVMVCITLLLLSGVYNFFVLSLPKARQAPIYHPLFGVKFLAALGVFFIASVMTGRAKAFAGWRANARLWLGVCVALATVVVLISGVLRFLPFAK